MIFFIDYSKAEYFWVSCKWTIYATNLIFKYWIFHCKVHWSILIVCHLSAARADTQSEVINFFELLNLPSSYRKTYNKYNKPNWMKKDSESRAKYWTWVHNILYAADRREFWYVIIGLKFFGGKCCVSRRVDLMKHPWIVLPQFGSFILIIHGVKQWPRISR